MDLTALDVDEASLAMLTGYDMDLSRQVNPVSSRVHDLLAQI